MKIPALGFGTFRLTDEVAYQAVKSALSLGYRHIDTAQIYGNESQVGQAVADSQLDREQLFVTTKVWNDNLSQARFIESVKESLAKLQMPYLDLLLIHWPAPSSGVKLQEAILALYQAQQSGLTKHIGVSNFTIEQLALCKSLLPKDTPVVNQIEVHPYLQNNRLRKYCQSQGIAVTAYMPFAVGKVIKDKVINTIADKHKATPAQVVIAWILRQGMSTIPSSTKPKNMLQNLAGQHLALDEEDMANIRQLDRGDRQANPDFSPKWD